MSIFPLLWISNFTISVFNAWSVGRTWTDSKAAGGWPRFTVWCGAVMSACGFIWCYGILEALIFLNTGHLTKEQANGLVCLGYLIVILPVLGSGLALTVHSWATFARQRTAGNGLITGWNTFAQAHNTSQAIEGIPKAVAGAGKAFEGKGGSSGSGSSGGGGGSKGSGGGDKGGGGGGGPPPDPGIIVVLLALAAVILGVLTTYLIVRFTADHYARAMPRDSVSGSKFASCEGSRGSSGTSPRKPRQLSLRFGSNTWNYRG
jgi:hypothetical protein